MYKAKKVPSIKKYDLESQFIHLVHKIDYPIIYGTVYFKTLFEHLKVTNINQYSKSFLTCLVILASYVIVKLKSNI